MCELYFYGINGKKLATYNCNYNDQDGGDGSFWYNVTSRNLYFGGKLIRSNGVTVVTDRLGSVRANSNGEQFSYFPYGEERTTTANGREKFGTYIRDLGGVDYADQRYYASVAGRFQTADPSTGSDPTDAGSWNKYSYVGNDPVNFADPSGLNRLMCDVYTEFGCAGSQPTAGGGVVTNWINSGEGWTIGSVVFLPGDPVGGGDPIGGRGAPDASPTNWQLMPAALKQALADLAKPGCGDTVFAGGIAKGYDPAEVLQALVNGTAYRSLQVKDLWSGVGSQESSRFRLPFQERKVNIEINSFNDCDPNSAYWNDGYAIVNALTLLHELGHAFNDLFGPGSSTIEKDRSIRGQINPAAEDRNAARLAPCDK